MKSKKLIRSFAAAILLICLCSFGYSCFTDYQVDQIKAEGGVSLKLTEDRGVSSATQSGYVVKKDDAGWYKKGSAAQVKAKIREGYTFDGWYKGDVKLGSSEQYLYIIKEYSVLEARTKPIEYSITYDLNGGSSSNPDIYTVEDNITLKSPEKEGYTFTGWTGSNGTIAQKDVTISIGNTGDKAYTANWRPNVYTVKYDPNGGTGTMANSSHTYDTAGTLAANGFDRTGYTFREWNTEADGAGTSYMDGASIKNLSSTDGGSVTLYAQWKTMTYKISFDLAGGTMSENPADYTIETPTFVLKNPVKPGYTFTGWTGSNGTTPGISVKVTKGSAGDRSYTANWKPNTYEIKYDSNTGSGYMANSSHSYDTEKNLAPNEYKKSGHFFKGWNTSADGLGTSYEDQASVTNLSDAQGAVVTLYAQWGINSITYELNGGTQDTRNPSTYDTGAEITKLYNPSKANCRFDGWYTESSCENRITGIRPDSTGPVTLYAKWTESEEVFLKNSYIDTSVNGQAYIYLDINGDSLVSGVQLPTWTELDGQDDIIWYECTKGNYEINGITYNYRALVKKDEHKGEYGPYNSHVYYRDLSNTSHSLGKTEQYYLGADTGYHLEYDNGCLSRTCTVGLQSYYCEGITAYGKFEVCAGNCGACNYKYPLYIYFTEYYASCVHLGEHKTGEKIDGYCTHNGGRTNTVYNGQTSGTYSHTYNYCPGHIVANTYTVRYHSNGGNGDMADSSHTYGVEKKLTTNRFTNEGLTFLGWNTEANGSGTSYTDGESVLNLTDANGQVITLYAQWGSNELLAEVAEAAAVEEYTGDAIQNDVKGHDAEENDAEGEKNSFGNESSTPDAQNTYAIRYDGNGSTEGIMEDGSFVLEKESDLAPNGYVREGYEFLGWNTSADGSGIFYEDQASVFNLSDTPDTVVILYAQWAGGEVD